MNAAAVLDLGCGAVLLYLAANVLPAINVRRHARNALFVCFVAMISDWIGGLFGISALIGLLCSYFIIREPG